MIDTWYIDDRDDRQIDDRHIEKHHQIKHAKHAPDIN